MHGMDLGTMWASMGPIPKAVVFVLLFMSIYSIAVGETHHCVCQGKKTIQYFTSTYW